MTAFYLISTAILFLSYRNPPFYLHSLHNPHQFCKFSSSSVSSIFSFLFHFCLFHFIFIILFISFLSISFDFHFYFPFSFSFHFCFIFLFLYFALDFFLFSLQFSRSLIFLNSDVCRNVFAFFLWLCGIRNG